ncbi:MAG TPA: iron-sulfur cluster repair di-iron protein [Flavobacteriaceae bacterium]|nr:iron-sulfur cluster repair di-iron protein [Flavobacteriaceae bacterium]
MKNKTIAQIVSSDIRTSKIFKKYGIDFCCGGGKLLSKVCEEKNINKSTVLDEIKQLDNKSIEPKFDKMDLELLINHIIETHHKYVREMIPIIKEFAEKVSKVHGGSNPEILLIARVFSELSIELLQHLIKEEKILFPHIIKLSAKEKNKTSFSTSFDSIENPIKMMELDHSKAGNYLKQIKILSNYFKPPLHACNTYKALYHNLKEFQDDLHIHIHLENNILFPKALEME